jgi:hypothetical protein
VLVDVDPHVFSDYNLLERSLLSLGGEKRRKRTSILEEEERIFEDRATCRDFSSRGQSNTVDQSTLFRLLVCDAIAFASIATEEIFYCILF